ncbi:Thioredoxin-like fold protein [Akanthomyces lecanii RCEF 1005]|uniref:Thioredoxin-like fold protein n=1 Tax=Akanthomyces lecanii RCEF 1005 TaxID=1081108 RepID=A0A168G150_CORDF|nr:Thioredoxin-like fold protein [Akanthomyces lecanii RCEF 1005]
MAAFNIKVVSDTVCPWCYVGHRQLEQAIKLWHTKHPDSKDTFKIEFFPYQLMPEFPRGPGKSMDKETLYRERFGAAQRQQGIQRLTAVGVPLGINFRFGGNVGNTRDSHRLIELSKKYGSEVEMKTVDGIFAAYFEKEKDITTYEVLGEVAKLSGIPEADFQKAIVESDEYGAQIDKAVAGTRENGISGVPDFTIQDRFQWSGARDPEAFVELLEKVKEMGL